MIICLDEGVTTEMFNKGQHISITAQCAAPFLYQRSKMHNYPEFKMKHLKRHFHQHWESQTNAESKCTERMNACVWNCWCELAFKKL